MHPQTIDTLVCSFESQSAASKRSDEKQELEHSIISVQIEHYSFNEDETFMIVKTIEEMSDNEDNYNVIHTIRIFKEKVRTELHPELASSLIKLREEEEQIS